jgi:hypothetical protein
MDHPDFDAHETVLFATDRVAKHRATSEVADSIARGILDTPPTGGGPPRFSDSQSPVESW